MLTLWECQVKDETYSITNNRKGHVIALTVKHLFTPNSSFSELRIAQLVLYIKKTIVDGMQLDRQ